MADEARQNAVDEALTNLYQMSDEGKLGEALCFLAMQPHHYSKLAKIMRSERAMQAYVDRMLQPPPDQNGQGEADSAEEAEMMLNESRDRFGSHLKRMEDGGIVDAAILTAMKKSSGAIFGGGSAAATVLMNSSSQALARAAAMSTAAQLTGCLSLVSAVQGQFASSWFYLLYSNKAAAEATVSRQLACNLARKGQLCKYAGKAALVLQVGMLGYEFYSNIRAYWHGEIDGPALAENLVTAVTTFGANMAGGWAGAAVCAGAGPAGLIFGVVAGGVIASGLTGVMVKGIFLGIFGSDRDRALGKAYDILGLQKGASDHTIRHAYLELGRRHHPDKGGEKERFIEVNSAYELIRASRVS